MYKKDYVGVTYSVPKMHIINIYCNRKIIHRVFEPNLKRHVFIPVKEDNLEIAEKTYEVTSRSIKYNNDRIVASIYVKEVVDKYE